jgi:hypothetical protein
LKEGLAEATQFGQVNTKEALIELIRIDSSYTNSQIGLGD